MTRSFPRFRKSADPASEVVRRALVAAGWVNLVDRQAYEVPPGLVWPLPGGPLTGRLLGVPAQDLRDVGLSEDQADLPEIFKDPDQKAMVLTALRGNLAYRIGGCWHYAECQHPNANGKDLQRLENWAILAAAAKPWLETRSHLISGLPMEIGISNTDRQKVTPTGRSQSPTVDFRWAQLVAGPVRHWTTGFAFGDGCDPGGMNGSLLVQAVALPPGADKKATKNRLILTPLGVALAAGFRGRVSCHVGSGIYHDAPIIELVDVIRKIPKEPARRLLLHILCATMPKDPADGLASYLEDPWILAALLGTKTRTMTPDNRDDLLRRRGVAAVQVAEAVGGTRVQEFVCRTLLPILPAKASARRGEGKGTADRKANSRNRTGQEITPLPRGQAAGDSRQDTADVTVRHPQPNAKTPETPRIHPLISFVMQVFRGFTAIFRSQDSIRNVKPLPAPDTESKPVETGPGWGAGQGTGSPSVDLTEGNTRKAPSGNGFVR